MSDRLQVIEDGVVSSPEPKSERPSWLLAAVGFAVGLGLGIVVVQPAAEPDPEPVSLASPDIEDDATNTTIAGDAEGLGVSDVVPGFPDAIVAVARTSGSALNHVLWPVSGDVIIRAMAGGSDVALDAASQFVAMTEPVPRGDGALLSMGRFNTIRPLTTGVLSYAWHDSTIGSLSYTAGDASGTVLYTVRADLESIPVATIDAPQTTLVGWGDWGWALQRGPNEIALLTPSGEPKDIESGVALATHPSGWVFAVDGNRSKLISAGGGVRQIQADMTVGTARTARFSPDASRVAVAGTGGFGVVDLDTGEFEVLSQLVAPSLAWSSDSRFVVAPTASGVVVVDLADGARLHIVLRDQWFLAAGVTPLRSS